MVVVVYRVLQTSRGGGGGGAYSTSHTYITLRFRGQCHHEPPPQSVVADHLWHVLGRIALRQCREEVLQVYCAYHYSPQGHCVPAAFIHQNTENQDRLSFKFDSLPDNGERPDLTEYRKIFHNPHMGLIPARIGFLILAHKSPQALMELLHLIYRPHHFYVFHIDQRTAKVRDDLVYLLQKEFHNASNIHVLPANRSFKTSWGSFQILRAQLEGFEELLRMGIWDFGINLSGADLPLRDIDDLGAMLAPYRGHTFLRIHKALNFSEEKLMALAWHACNAHVYNVTRRQAREETVYSHSQWGIFSRSFLDFITSAERSSVVDQLQFYLQTTLIPDESYLGTMLMTSHFKPTYVPASIHFLKYFEQNNIDNLCRHIEDTDACGQGPAMFVFADQPVLQAHSHHFFFARKFSIDPKEPFRKSLVEALKDGYYTALLTQLISPVLLRQLTELAIEELLGHHVDDVPVHILHWQAVPRLIPTNPCCQLPLQRGMHMFDEFILWITFMVDNNKGIMQQARASLVPQPTFKCFPAGHIRALHLTTRQDGVPGIPAIKPESYKMGLPVATHPAGGNILWVHLYIHLGPVEKKCKDREKDENMQKQQYMMFRNLKPGKPPKDIVLFDAVLTDPIGQVRCREEFPVELSANSLPKNADSNLLTKGLRCGTLEEGRWTVTLRQKDIDNPYVYSQSVYLSSKEELVFNNEDRLHGLWTVTDAMFIEDEKQTDHYYAYRTASSQGKDSTTSGPDRNVTQHKFGGFVNTPNSEGLLSSASDIAETPRSDLNRDSTSRHNPTDHNRLVVDAMYYFLFGFTVLATLFIYNLCSSRSKSTRGAMRRTLLRKSNFGVVLMVVSLQVLFYQLGHSTSTDVAQTSPVLALSEHKHY